MLRILLILTVVLLGVFAVFGSVDAPERPGPLPIEVVMPESSDGEDAIRASSSRKLLVGGDVMLARQVERYIREEGYGYPFRGIRDTFYDHDAVLINFEATVPKTHIPTPSLAFSFSVASDIASALPSFGVTHAGLANNHAFDYGAEAYEEARAVLVRSGIVPFGHPEIVSPEDIARVTVGKRELAVIPVHAVFREPKEAELAAAFAAASSSDIQVAYIHWGVEYEPYHDPAQERIAKRLIGLGADIVIGHHPHVVQDIARYDHALVFYSLGNLVFDQYWNEDVRTGLMLSLTERDGALVVGLIPTRSETRSVSELLSGPSRQDFLDALAERSTPGLAEGIREGLIAF
jgi:hypothetical protein